MHSTNDISKIYYQTLFLIYKLYFLNFISITTKTRKITHPEGNQMAHSTFTFHTYINVTSLFSYFITSIRPINRNNIIHLYKHTSLPSTHLWQIACFLIKTKLRREELAVAAWQRSILSPFSLWWCPSLQAHRRPHREPVLWVYQGWNKMDWGIQTQEICWWKCSCGKLTF